MINEIPKWALEQLNIFDIGNTIQLSGVIYSDSEVMYLCLMPDEPLDDRQVRILELDQEGWKKLIRQTDLVETEVLERAADGKLAKAVLRKSTRKVEQFVTWNVFRRDQFRCRYCGKNDVPLTVDHLITWEENGPTIEANLVACCRRCNKERGNMPYELWLQSPYYRKVSKGLQPNFYRANEQILENRELEAIPLRAHRKSR